MLVLELKRSLSFVSPVVPYGGHLLSCLSEEDQA